MLQGFQPSPTFGPLYRQIKSLILHGLESGEWRPGEAIPSENELALRFSVSQGTVRKAIDEMAAENLLVRRQGKGTYVASHNGADQFANFRFLRLMPDRGTLESPENMPLECWHANADQEVSRILGIELGAAITTIRRLLKFVGKPVVIDEIYLPGDVFSGLTLEMMQDYQGSFYGLLESQFGVRMIRADERLRAIAADRDSALLLGVGEGIPLLSVERVSYTYGDRPVEWRRGLYLTTEHHYLNKLG